MALGFFSRLFGDNTRVVGSLQPTVDRINALEPNFQKLTDKQLKEKTPEFKSRIEGGEPLESILPEAFAAVREAAKRTIGQRHFDVQLMGGIVLHQGKIAEMKTGEGKTLVATLPAYLNALTGKGVHIVTVNDYLAKRDADWMGPIYDALGISVAAIGHETSLIFKPVVAKEERQVLEIDNLVPVTRREAYAADITFGTNNEFGFDYLRDNMVMDISQMVQRGHAFAIVDEVDSILIDEARTPLIISAPAEESAKTYQQFAAVIPRLKKDEDYKVDEKMRAAALTDAGIKKVEDILKIANLYSPEHVNLVHHLEESLKAFTLFTRDKDYVVKDGEVIIVDEFTGRLMHGRRYSGGLHQAIEAKEGVEVKRESETLATISFQNLFRMYDKLAGMTGTAATEAEEFYKIYKLDVVEIPTNKPMIRQDSQDLIYKTEESKFAAVVSEIAEKHKAGQPMLVGTISIEKNERLSRYLKKAGIPHELLNAKHHEREAKIIANAGKIGAVTVATNMAGRGVDIILGGRPPEGREASKKDKVERWKREHEKVIALGGLHVVGTERHESRRIDNQLRGRSGRQGDPGSSKFFVSLEDDLMRIFGGERLKSLMDRLGLPEDQPIEHPLISRSIEQAQKKVEGHNFDIRKHLLEYDDVMNQHRKKIYAQRKEILEKEDVHEVVASLMAEEERKEYEKKVVQYGLEVIRRAEKFVFLRVIDTLWIEHLNTMEELREGIALRGYGQRDPLVEYKHEAYNLFQGLQNTISDRVVEMLMNLELRTPTIAPPPSVLQQRPIVTRGADERLAGGAIQQPGEDATATAIASEEELAAGEPVGARPSAVSQAPSAPSGVQVTVRTAGQTADNPAPPLAGQGMITPQAATTGPKLNVGRNDPCPCGVVDSTSGKVRKYKKCFLAGNPECGLIKSGLRPPV
jgi:preprotein translocase subunit SecA